MGLLASQSIDARPRYGAACGADCPKAGDDGSYKGRKARRWIAAAAFGLGLYLALASGAAAERLRIATWHLELHRKGPGLLLRDLVQGKAEDAAAAALVLKQIRPDILLLTDVDWDYGLAAATELARLFETQGLSFPHLFALQPNTGLKTGLDMDGDGRTGGPRDAQGFGYFTGQGGLLLLSRFPVIEDGVQDFSSLLWSELRDALLPQVDGAPFPSAEALAAQRLSHAGHWVVPVALPTGEALTLLAFAASPPVFDGPEDRNGKRNHDEVRLWSLFLDGTLGTVPEGPVVVLGKANLDPVDGEGRHTAIAGLIDHPRLQDPGPRSLGGVAAANPGHQGDPAFDTADWDDPVPGNLRVSYVLPDAGVTVQGAGVVWPMADDPLFEAAQQAGRHKLVWVDIEIP